MVEVEELIEVVGASIAEGMIVGVGMGASSENRLNAFIKMIDHVADLISSGSARGRVNVYYWAKS